MLFVSLQRDCHGHCLNGYAIGGIKPGIVFLRKCFSVMVGPAVR